ncbi:hypothetical protein DW020_00940 [Clostridium sp. AF37-5AT]|nr:hypothetical protein DW020_00940 [Clostridium sp. AF37-5AT]
MAVLRFGGESADFGCWREYAVSVRTGVPGDAGMVPLSSRATAKGGKEMTQLASLKQVSSFFQRIHPRAKRKPDPRIKGTPVRMLTADGWQ